MSLSRLVLGTLTLSAIFQSSCNQSRRLHLLQEATHTFSLRNTLPRRHGCSQHTRQQEDRSQPSPDFGCRTSNTCLNWEVLFYSCPTTQPSCQSSRSAHVPRASKANTSNTEKNNSQPTLAVSQPSPVPLGPHCRHYCQKRFPQNEFQYEIAKDLFPLAWENIDVCP